MQLIWLVRDRVRTYTIVKDRGRYKAMNKNKCNYYKIITKKKSDAQSLCHMYMCENKSAVRFHTYIVYYVFNCKILLILCLCYI
jgi:hypothetical protein